MLVPITLKRSLFSTTTRVPLHTRLTDLTNDALAHMVDHQPQNVMHKAEYLTLLYSLQLFLTGNPKHHRTQIFNLPPQQSPPTVEDCEHFIQTTITNLIKKPPTQYLEVNTARCAMLYELNRFSITED